MSQSRESSPIAIDLRDLLAQQPGQGPVWTHAAEELNVNLLVWPQGHEVAEHVNSEVDVLIVGMQGQGSISIDGQPYDVAPQTVVLIPKGARRAIMARSAGFAYLSIHRRRAGLQPLRPK
jgi:quercetin dioxygenase-like cupin family protein